MLYFIQKKTIINILKNLSATLPTIEIAKYVTTALMNPHIIKLWF